MWTPGRANRAGRRPGAGRVGARSRPRPLGWLGSGRLPAVHPPPIDPVVCRGPYALKELGRLVLGRDSRLDAFSGSPTRTWLPSAAGCPTTGPPAVRPPRSSRTRGSSPQSPIRPRRIETELSHDVLNPARVPLSWANSPTLGTFSSPRMRRADIEVPNPAVDVDSWAGSACYPRGSFYPLSQGPPTRRPRITRSGFRPCPACPPRSQAPLRPCALRVMSIHPEGTVGRLRYSVGGDRPSQTAPLAPSPHPLQGRG